MLNLGHFLETLSLSSEGYQPTGDEPAISSVVIDSREAGPGSLFVAFAGEQTDGHDYVQAAFDQGAVAALVQRTVPGDHATIDLCNKNGPDIAPGAAINTPVCLLVEDTLTALQTVAKAWRERFPIRVIGITGSVGKTSTKELVYSVLSRRYRTLKSAGNQNNEIGLPLTLLKLQRHHQRAVLEMGMYTTGEISRLCELAQPEIGVLTIVGPVHLERAGTMEAIVAAKQELVEALPEYGTAVLNKDDERVMGMAAHTQASVFTYGLDSSADLWADNIRSMGLEGVRFTLHHGREAMNVQVPLLGRHSVHTALRAAAVGLVDGLTWPEIIAGLSETKAQLRLVAVPGPNNSLIIDDTYNSSHDSVMAACNLLKDLDGRHVVVLGDMLELGYMAEPSHRLVGRRAVDVADVLITVGQLGRIIGEEALAVGMPADRVMMVDDAGTAVPLLEELIQERDVILIKGSLGMRMDRIVAALGRDN
ncbi:MAG: UDP-N-acetylmuramoyl-tripeptide--D-alanyl-D-alanine ligase [Anaerolineae bacterium]